MIPSRTTIVPFSIVRPETVTSRAFVTAKWDADVDACAIALDGIIDRAASPRAHTKGFLYTAWSVSLALPVVHRFPTWAPRVGDDRSVG